MVSTESSADWLATKVLVYDRTLVERQRRVWSPSIWRLIRVGIPLILLWGILGVYVPVLVAEVKYQARVTVSNFQAVLPRGVLMPSWSLEILPAWVQGYALEIPTLGVREPVIEGVDAGDKAHYMEALTRGVAHAGGTGLPGQAGVQYYFAHSSGLPFWGGRAVTFATLYKLNGGDEVVIYRENKKYRYQVVEKRIVNPDDVSLLQARDTSERVVLQTCWPLGTNWQRLLVVADRI